MLLKVVILVKFVNVFFFFKPFCRGLVKPCMDW